MISDMAQPTVRGKHENPKSISVRVSLYDPDFCGILISENHVRYLYERVRLQLLVSHADVALCAAAGAFDFADGAGAASVLRLSMLDKYKGTGWKKPYLIFGMCDETFSINCTAEIPADVDRGWFYFFVTLLDRFYWISGATLGGLPGNLIRFNTEGLDFVMTAMFTVIFLDQWLKEKRHISEWVGLAASVLCLCVFGTDNFLIPTMICVLAALTALRKPMEKQTEVSGT